MMSFPLIYHPQHLDYWLVTGVCEFFGKFYWKAEDRDRKKSEFVRATVPLIPQKIAYKSITERLHRELKINAGLCSLNSGDQPSLLIED